jgi:hypothetical protein
MAFAKRNRAKVHAGNHARVSTDQIVKRSGTPGIIVEWNYFSYNMQLV